MTATPPPLVGRDRELAALREHLAAALGARGSLVLMGGEAGIGKTALAEALGREAAASQAAHAGWVRESRTTLAVQQRLVLLADLCRAVGPTPVSPCDAADGSCGERGTGGGRSARWELR